MALENEEMKKYSHRVGSGLLKWSSGGARIPDDFWNEILNCSSYLDDV